ncbi:MAG: hypothetical protein O3B09_02880 [Proteobacteria bacterium]|nr:hypothetical protein [Pseudomonadota bacterium]
MKKNSLCAASFVKAYKEISENRLKQDILHRVKESMEEQNAPKVERPYQRIQHTNLFSALGAIQKDRTSTPIPDIIENIKDIFRLSPQDPDIDVPKVLLQLSLKKGPKFKCCLLQAHYQLQEELLAMRANHPQEGASQITGITLLSDEQISSEYGLSIRSALQGDSEYLKALLKSGLIDVNYRIDRDGALGSECPIQRKQATPRPTKTKEAVDSGISLIDFIAQNYFQSAPSSKGSLSSRSDSQRTKQSHREFKSLIQLMVDKGAQADFYYTKKDPNQSNFGICASDQSDPDPKFHGKPIYLTKF